MIDVSIAKDTPDDPRAVLVLAHGAGGDMNDALLRALGPSLSKARIEVIRFNFPYRESGRRAPGAQPQSEDCYREVAGSVRRDGLPLYLGGKSYGGRIATHIVADGFEADGLVLLSYPLHPPGKPERVRDAHLGAISVPMLFCQGTRDPFATPELFAAVTGRLSLATVHHVEGGDHSLRVRGRSASDVVGELTETVTRFVG